MNHTRLEFMFRKKHTLHIYAHPSRHIHVPHVHRHDTLYTRVYNYTHCGHKGHLAKFCYDRINTINFASKSVWVKKGANPHGPKNVWVPKFTSIVFNVGVGYHMI